MSPEEKPGIADYYFLANETGTFDTVSSEGDPEVMDSFRSSCIRAAEMALSTNSRLRSARALLRWANNPKGREPNIKHVSDTFRAAGLETFSVTFKPE